jgi:iron complex outermembrane receptor protein
LNFIYAIHPKSIVNSIHFNALVNNLFNVAYISNGYHDPDWGTYYFPQATRNFLVGMTIKF